MAYRLGIASCRSHSFTLSIGTTWDTKGSKESMSVAPPYYLDSSFTFSERHLCQSHPGSPGSELDFHKTIFCAATSCHVQSTEWIRRSRQAWHTFGNVHWWLWPSWSLQMCWSHQITSYPILLIFFMKNNSLHKRERKKTQKLFEHSDASWSNSLHTNI